MTISQITIFIENGRGTLIRVLDAFKKSGVQLITTTIADTADYGLFRIICDNPPKAMEALAAAGIQAVLTKVFAVKLEDRPGCAADTIALFATAGVNISYLYSFLMEGKGILVFNTDNPELAASVIKDNSLETL